jgi:hypothetical protein
MEDTQRRIPYSIKGVYNHMRLHYAIGYCFPSENEFIWGLEKNKETHGKKEYFN